MQFLVLDKRWSLTRGFSKEGPLYLCMDNRTTSLNLVYMHAGVHQRAVVREYCMVQLVSKYMCNARINCMPHYPPYGKDRGISGRFDVEYPPEGPGI